MSVNDHITILDGDYILTNSLVLQRKNTKNVSGGTGLWDKC